MPFHHRKRELAPLDLDEYHRRQGGKMFVLSGRGGVGKSVNNQLKQKDPSRLGSFCVVFRFGGDGRI